MPKNTFSPIETAQYRLTPTLLEIVKGCGLSGDMIFRENHVSATIIETLGPSNITLAGKKVAVHQYKIVAVMMTDDEVKSWKITEAKREGEEKVKREDLLRSNKTVAASMIKNAPPPLPPSLLK